MEDCEINNKMTYISYTTQQTPTQCSCSSIVQTQDSVAILKVFFKLARSKVYCPLPKKGRQECYKNSSTASLRKQTV